MCLCSRLQVFQSDVLQTAELHLVRQRPRDRSDPGGYDHRSIHLRGTALRKSQMEKTPDRFPAQFNHLVA